MRPKDEAKEQLILDTALAMIARVGLSGLKMSDLAKEAGIATGTVYNYYHDKEAVIRSLYLYLTRKTTSDLVVDIPAHLPLRGRIQALAYAYLQKCLQHPEYDAFFEQYYRSPFFRETPEELANESALMQPILDVVLQGQREMLIKNADPELLVTLVCGMIGEVARQALYAERAVSETEWQTIFDVIWCGIRS